MKHSLKVISIMAVVVWIGVIIGFTLQTGEVSSATSGRITALVIRIFRIKEIKRLELFIRKLAHFSEYAILGAILTSACCVWKKRSWWSIPLSAVVACCDEFTQSFVPGRGPSPRDVLIDCSGALAGFAIIWSLICLKRWLRKR